MKDKNIFYKEFKIGVLSIICSFLLLSEPKPKSITDIKEVIINYEVHRKFEKIEKD